ncbi:MAG TPA: hypothetical protein VLM79_25825 [Kofleriaceae bacterium]|nr:hypothetical protein [Kofleriaceae bacterium]
MTTDRLATTVGIGTSGSAHDADEALSTRLRDLALVEIDALLLGDGTQELVAAFADDVADALREARTRIAALRSQLGGADPLAILDATPRQRASDAGGSGVGRIRARLATQADAARALARLTDLAAGLVPKLFEADRRR